MFRFPWGDMHSLNLGWFLQKFNELREDWATAEAGIDGALDAEIQKAEDALSDVFAARDAAAASATSAAGSATAAGTSATAAQNSATAAGNSATLANNKATAAGLSEAAAAQSATQAGNSATAAAGSATQAGQSATNAAGSATAAGNSATAAAGSATAAAGSATAAATSETNAAASAARAEEVEESIPEDYTNLSNDVDQLKTDLIDTTDDVFSLWGDIFNKDYSFNLNGRTGSVKGTYLYAVASANSSTPVAFPIHGNSINAAFRYDTWDYSALPESDFIEIPSAIYDFSIEFKMDKEYSEDNGSQGGIFMSLYTIIDGTVTLVNERVNQRYNRGVDILYPSVLTEYPILRQTKKLFMILGWKKTNGAGKNISGRIRINSCVSPRYHYFYAQYYEIDFTARRAYFVNDFIEIGNRLYIVTANIANGATITVGTNVQMTTITEILTRLLN